MVKTHSASTRSQNVCFSHLSIRNWKGLNIDHCLSCASFSFHSFRLMKHAFIFTMKFALHLTWLLRWDLHFSFYFLTFICQRPSTCLPLLPSNRHTTHQYVVQQPPVVSPTPQRSCLIPSWLASSSSSSELNILDISLDVLPFQSSTSPVLPILVPIFLHLLHHISFLDDMTNATHDLLLFLSTTMSESLRRTLGDLTLGDFLKCCLENDIHLENRGTEKNDYSHHFEQFTIQSGTDMPHG